MEQQSLIIFTDSYPFGTADNFIAAEIDILTMNFNKVVVVPRNCQGNQRKMPTGAELLVIDERFKAKHSISKYFIKWFFPILKLTRLLLSKSSHKTYYLRNIKSIVVDLIVFLEEGEIYLRGLEPFLKRNSVLYFFWFIEPFTQLAVHKKIGKLSQRMVSRGLGYDYDPAQTKLGLFRFREIDLMSIDKLVINSRWGANLVRKLYPPFALKIDYSYLGLPDTNSVNPFPDGKEFHLISCSYAIELKRIHLIVDILAHIKFPIRWTHLGKGPLLEDIRQYASHLPPNVKVELLGFVPSVTDYYCTEPIDLFITTTQIESLPFSVAEAIAHGIPAMATAVCGIPEIVTDKSGFLMDREFNPAFAAKIITQYHEQSFDNKLKLRASAKRFFKEHFTSEKNINEFIVKFLN